MIVFRRSHRLGAYFPPPGNAWYVVKQIFDRNRWTWRAPFWSNLQTAMQLRPTRGELWHWDGSTWRFVG